jgi:hypothetical protein
MDTRLPAHLEISGLIRRVQAEGGFATVIHKGDRDAGTILVVVTQNGVDSVAYERMPQLDGSRAWTVRISEDIENKEKFSEFLERRVNQDPDLWILELDVAHGERFIGL